MRFISTIRNIQLITIILFICSPVLSASTSNETEYDLNTLVYDLNPPAKKTFGYNNITNASGSTWDAARKIGTFGYARYESNSKSRNIAIGIRSFTSMKAASTYWNKAENDFAALKLIKHNNKQNIYLSSSSQYNSAVMYFLIGRVMFDVTVMSMDSNPLNTVKEIADKYPVWVESRLK